MDNGHNNNELSILCEQKDMQQQHSPREDLDSNLRPNSNFIPPIIVEEIGALSRVQNQIPDPKRAAVATRIQHIRSSPWTTYAKYPEACA